MTFIPVSDATHLSVRFYVDSDERPFPEINVVCRLHAATAIPEVAVDYTAELFDLLCEAYDADLLGVSLPQPHAWAAMRRPRVALFLDGPQARQSTTRCAFTPQCGVKEQSD